LRLRLLAYFSWAFDSVAERAFLEVTESALGHFASWGYPVALSRKTVFELLDGGLLVPLEGERGADGHSLPKRLRLSASGYVHLTRLARLPAYRAAMACTTSWYDREMAESFVKQAVQAGGEAGVTIGDIAVSPALGFFEAYLASTLAREDARLADAIEKHPWTVEVRARASCISTVVRTRSEPPVPIQRSTSNKVDRSIERRGQLQLALNNDLAVEATLLPTIRREREYRGTVWIPRILWALEWASRHRLGPQTPAEMARILKNHGEIDVPHNNVARAFRDLRGQDEVAGLWRGVAKRYEIAPAGTLLLQTLIEEDQHASAPIQDQTLNRPKEK
jgi:hypothetical protein